MKERQNTLPQFADIYPSTEPLGTSIELWCALSNCRSETRITGVAGVSDPFIAPTERHRNQMSPNPHANMEVTDENHIKQDVELRTPMLDGEEYDENASSESSATNDCVGRLSDEEARRLAEETDLAWDASSIWGPHELDSDITNCIYHHEPDAYATYYEPFLGRGFGFWESVNERCWQTAVLSDCDMRVIRIHETIRDSSSAIVEHLRSIPVSSCLEQSLHELDSPTDDITRVARIVRLSAWTEIIRMTHSDARRNFEQYVRNLEERIVNSCSGVLRRYSGITLKHADFANALVSARENDFAFLDPPRNFSISEHERLAKCYRDLCARGVQSLVFIPPGDDVSQLYAGCQVQDILGPPQRAKRGKKKSLADAPQRPVLARVVIGRER